MGVLKTRTGLSRATMPVMTALAFTVTSPDDEILFAEHAYISACIDDGVWRPSQDGLDESHFPASTNVFRWISRYALESGNAMVPLQALQANFPEVVYFQGMSRRWSSSQLLDSDRTKRVAQALRKAWETLKSGETDQAMEIMAAGARTASPGARAGVLLHEITEESSTTPLPSLYPSIEACGGISEGDYVLVLARTNVGKSYRLMQHAAACVEAGKSVVYMSLEMRRGRCLTRLHQLTMGPLWKSLDFQARQNRMRDWQYEHGGLFRLIDDSDGPMSTLFISRQTAPGDIVFIDYLGLMRNNKGSRMTEDWRVAAEISNTLRSLTTELGITVFAGAQANRTVRNTGAPDDLSISQTDAIGQDIDLGIALTRKTKDLPFTTNTVFKARNGSLMEGKWYTKFDPSNGDFSQISPETAWEMLQHHESREGIVV